MKNKNRMSLVFSGSVLLGLTVSGLVSLAAVSCVENEAIHTPPVNNSSSVNSATASKLVGKWNTTFGRYDETLTLKPDGSYVRVVSAVRGMNTPDNISVGKWKFDGRELELTDKDGSFKDRIRNVSKNKFEKVSDLGVSGVLTYERM